MSARDKSKLLNEVEGKLGKLFGVIFFSFKNK